MLLADQIRAYVNKEIIVPARQRGITIVHVKAGNVHAALGLKNRMPAVCGALDAAKFQDFAQVTVINRLGPLQGANAEWVFGL